MVKRELTPPCVHATVHLVIGNPEGVTWECSYCGRRFVPSPVRRGERAYGHARRLRV